MRAWMLFVILAVVAMPLQAEDSTNVASLGTPVDLPSLNSIDNLDRLITPVGLVQGDDGTRQRFYLAPIVGASWGQFLVEDASVLSGNLFTAGGAAGMAFTRPLGQTRLEFEGRYRDGMQQSIGVSTVGATDNWSTLVNVWRDFSVTDRAGVYGGGGIGAGGYRFLYDAGGLDYANLQTTQFAWQVGAGVIYAVSDRVTLDLGYRYYSVNASRGCDCPQPEEGILNQFISSDLLLSVRIYEPFRNWR